MTGASVMRARVCLQSYGLPCECPIARYLMPFHIFVSVHILSSLPAPLCHNFMSCLFEGVSIVLHLKSAYPSWLARIRSKLLCWSRGMDEQVQLDLEVRNIYYQDCKFFFSRYHNLKMESFMFSL
jgi:hypothetical protein